MLQKILVIGGYGGVGRNLVELLVANGGFHVTIGGPSTTKGQAFLNQLAGKYSSNSIDFRVVDASSSQSLFHSIDGKDLVVVTATVPDRMEDIARVALHHGADLMDILVRVDVVTQLKPFEKQVIEDGRIFITQCGFHPGMILPMMKMACTEMEDPTDIKVFMAMKPVFENPKSTEEIFYETIWNTPRILKDGKWIHAKYTDGETCSFSSHFGEKNCYPLPMPEIYDVKEILGINTAGAYVASFNWFIDYIVFTLAVIFGKLKSNWGVKVGSNLLYWSTKKYRNQKPRVEMVATALKKSDDKEQAKSITLISEDGYLLTAQATYSMILQYADSKQIKPGVHLMGELIDENKLKKDLINLGVTFQY